MKQWVKARCPIFFRIRIYQLKLQKRDNGAHNLSKADLTNESPIHLWKKSKGASTLCRTAKCNTLQLCRAAEVARHMPLMQSRPHFLQTFFRLPKLWNGIGELGVIFFFKLADTILKPLIHQMPRSFFWWDRQFADRIFRPRSIERHADATSTYTCGMAQLLPRRPCRTLPLCAARHSVDLPLWNVALHSTWTTCPGFNREQICCLNSKKFVTDCYIQ